MKWDPKGLGFICPHCGTPNPDGGDKCGNCDQNPFILPPKNTKLTKEQLHTFRMVTGARC
ncbi:hypothetical protein KJ763_02765 [Patescibacteria group bacterium]|nr:hypothetical protein [Patescibacteria group bacterium]